MRYIYRNTLLLSVMTRLYCISFEELTKECIVRGIKLHTVTYGSYLHVIKDSDYL